MLRRLWPRRAHGPCGGASLRFTLMDLAVVLEVVAVVALLLQTAILGRAGCAALPAGGNLLLAGGVGNAAALLHPDLGARWRSLGDVLARLIAPGIGAGSGRRRLVFDPIMRRLLACHVTVNRGKRVWYCDCAMPPLSGRRRVEELLHPWHHEGLFLHHDRENTTLALARAAMSRGKSDLSQSEGWHGVPARGSASRCAQMIFA